MAKRIEIPKEFMGVPVSEKTMKKTLAGKKKTRRADRQRKPDVVIPAGDLSNPENWVLLEGRTHGSYSYPDLIVSMHRLGYDSEAEKAANSLGLNVQNTGQEQDGTYFIGSINWEEALKLNLALGNIALNPRQGLDLLIDLRKGISGGKKLYDSKGNKVDVDRLRVLHNEIVEVRKSYRGEWFDADFKVINGGLHIKYNHGLVNGQLSAQTIEPLETCLTESGYMDIDSANRQGLATRKSQRKELYFAVPLSDNISVAGFFADSGWAGLSCVGNPTDSSASLGVRAARAKN